MAAPAELLPGKCSNIDPLCFRFSSKSLEHIGFYPSKSPVFEDPFPPFVRLMLVQAGFCVSTYTPGGWIFDYWIFQHDPPQVTAAARSRRSLLGLQAQSSSRAQEQHNPVRGSLTPISVAGTIG